VGHERLPGRDMDGAGRLVAGSAISFGQICPKLGPSASGAGRLPSSGRRFELLLDPGPDHRPPAGRQAPAEEVQADDEGHEVAARAVPFDEAEFALPPRNLLATVTPSLSRKRISHPYTHRVHG
jgi:hypothetical protein